ncbi:hypothetical protein ACOMHN_003923 [Nucella lapillus]
MEEGDLPQGMREAVKKIAGPQKEDKGENEALMHEIANETSKKEMAEFRDRTRRATNLVVFRLEEDTSKGKENGQTKDEESVQKLLGEIKGTHQPTEIRRLGKLFSGKEKDEAPQEEKDAVPAISRVHDAYIIALEEGARRKLEDASANHKVVPVDMTKTPPPVQPEEAITAFRADTLGAPPPVSDQRHRSKPQTEQALSQNHVQQQDSVTKQQQQPDSLPVSAPKNKSISPSKPPRQLNLQHKFAPQQSRDQQETGQPSRQEKQVDRPSVQQRSIQEQQVDRPSVHQRSSQEQQVDRPSVQRSSQEQQVDRPLVQRSSQEQQVDRPSVQQGSRQEQQVDRPSVQQRSSQEQQVDRPSVHHRSSQEQQVDTPSVQPPSPERWRELNGVHDASMPASSHKKAKSSPSKHCTMNGSVEELEGTEMMMMTEREQDSPRKGKGSRGKKGGSKAASNPDILLIKDMASQGELAPNGNSSGHNSLTQSAHDLSTYSPDFDPGLEHNLEDSLSEDAGPHREMAIDCPDSFVAKVKTPPRYPPPANAPLSTTPRVPPTTPSKNTDAVKDKARTDATLSDAAMMVAGGSQSKPSVNQLERLRKHQDELRKRREEENRQQQEQDFLRTSLRGSKKLQALENRRMAQGQQAAPPPAFGIINTAFVDAEEEDEEDEDEELVDDVDGVTAAQPVPADLYLKKNAGVDDLLSTMGHIRSRLNSADNTSTSNSTQEELFLKQLFHNPRFQHAVDIHQKMVDVTSRSPQPRPVAAEGSELLSDVSLSCSELSVRNSGSEAAVKELTQLLNKPVMKNLLQAHDEVADQQLQPALSTSESDLIDYPLVQYGEESVKIIHLEKTNEHLGATVKNEGDSVIIARIVQGGAAEKSGLLHEGDEILEVNSIEMRGKNVNEVSEILANMSGTITFMIIPADSGVNEMGKQGEIMHLRALFNYDPEDDAYIPCRELGISFLKGDILHAIQLTDPNWWQAHRDGEEEQHMLAGLIPSKAFQEQRETVRQQLNAEGKENKKRSRMCACGRKERKKKKKKKALYNGGVGEETEEILTYEEVTRYYPQPNRKRPIVLVSPADIGRQELRERLMESDFDRFAAAVPHTSRPPMAGEHHGKDYFFISRSAFEADMLNGKFIEYGEFQGNLYGTSVEAVRQVINQGRICALNLGPESLKIMRETDLKPYIIFISPPNMEKLRQLQMALGKPRPTDDQLKEMIERGREMEEAFSHYFDYILVNMDLDRSCQELMAEINRIETEPQWVPIVWVNNYM